MAQTTKGTATTFNRELGNPNFKTLPNASGNSKNYTEVFISAPQMIDALANGTEITLLEPPGENKYYVFDKIIIEYQSGTIAFNCDYKQGAWIAGGGIGGNLLLSILGSTLPSKLGEVITVLDPSLGDDTVSHSRWVEQSLNKPAILAFDGDGVTTMGTGKTFLKIWYSVHKFGTGF